MPTQKKPKLAQIIKPTSVEVACPHCEAPQESPRGSFHWDEFDKNEERACHTCGKRMSIRLPWNRNEQDRSHT